MINNVLMFFFYCSKTSLLSDTQFEAVVQLLYSHPELIETFINSAGGDINERTLFYQDKYSYFEETILCKSIREKKLDFASKLICHGCMVFLSFIFYI